MGEVALGGSRELGKTGANWALRVYLAAAYTERRRMRTVREILEDNQVAVTSRWIDYDFEAEDAPGSPWEYAQVDLEDLNAADALVAYVGEASTSGGYWTEVGYALGRGKPVVAVGEEAGVQAGRAGNPFLALARARVADTSELVRVLRGLLMYAGRWEPESRERREDRARRLRRELHGRNLAARGAVEEATRRALGEGER